MALERITAIPLLRDRIRDARRRRASVGCVPTMGALHAGHTALLDRARSQCDLLVATLFVNPLQFDRKDDLKTYPRDMEADLRACSRHGVDILFAPSAEDMYPRQPVATVHIERLAEGLCGASRPGHFRGVATVVLKLLNIVQPDFACFGEKDYQQLAIIRRLVEDTNLPVRIVGVETVREPDGLALSSRNLLLSSAERAAAAAIPEVLQEARRAIDRGHTDVGSILAEARDSLRREPLIRLDYLEIVDPDTLASVRQISGPVRIAAAAFLGTTRLIDNVPAHPPERG